MPARKDSKNSLAGIGSASCTLEQIRQVLLIYQHSDYLTGFPGYAIVGESVSYTRPSDATKVTRERTLATRMEGDRPAPASYTYEQKTATEKERFTIDFASVRFDLPDPVTLDPAARDLLKEAWGRRLVLPESIIIQGQFVRQIDKDLERARWRNDVTGDFQVYGMGNIQIVLNEQDDEIHRTCEGHIRWIFDLLRDRPFEDEFKGCGFEMEPQGAGTIVRVYGYPKALAFKIAGGRLAGGGEGGADWLMA